MKEILKLQLGIDYNEGIELLSAVLDATFDCYVETGQVLMSGTSRNEIYAFVYLSVRMT